MKKKLLIIGIVITNTISAQLLTSGGAVGTTLSTAPVNNVGIGTNNPETLLDVQNRIYINPEGPSYGVGIKAYTTPWARGYHFLSADGKTNLGGFSAVGPGGNVDYYFIGKEYTDTTARFYRTDNRTVFYGNVGIGTNYPETLLDVQNRIYINPEAPSYGVGIKAYTTPWARGYHFLSADGKTNLGGFSAVGPGGNVDYYFIGKEYNDTTARFYRTDNRTVFYGNVGVKEKLEAKEVKVTLTPTADFVFEEEYLLPKLEEIEKHIKEKKHLPEIASAKEMEKDGVNVGAFQIKLLQKIEELTLYSIEQNKRLLKLEEDNRKLNIQVEDLKTKK